MVIASKTDAKSYQMQANYMHNPVSRIYIRKFSQSMNLKSNICTLLLVNHKIKIYTLQMIIVTKYEL